MTWSDDPSLPVEIRAALKVSCPLCGAAPETLCNWLHGPSSPQHQHRARLNLGAQLHPKLVSGAP